MGADAGQPAFRPVTLEGRWVRLEPLEPRHLEALAAAGADESLWQYYARSFARPGTMAAFLDDAFDQQRAGTALPFAVVERARGEPIGSTRFGNIDRTHRRAEIGWTWYAPRWQRTPVNTECKYLLLRHAFEMLGLLRVEFKTDALNQKSRSALERIGATFEGIFRKHMVMHTGRLRDSAYYSIVDDEWPRVKRDLDQKLARPWSGGR